MADTEWLEGPEAVSQGFDAGNYANSYDCEDLESALEDYGLSDRTSTDTFRASFILGFFASYTLEEIPQSDREEYDSAYFSAAGKHAIACGYFESRADEYTKETEDM
jgi:hypothetical protein